MDLISPLFFVWGFFLLFLTGNNFLLQIKVETEKKKPNSAGTAIPLHIRCEQTSMPNMQADLQMKNTCRSV